VPGIPGAAFLPAAGRMARRLLARPRARPRDISRGRTAGAQRLLWRAGFGPRPGEAQALAGRPLQQVVYGLTRPAGEAALNGPAPVNEAGKPLAPAKVWGDDHCWWLDRMVRSDQQLVERMTFIWHDWFANSNEQVDSQQLMLDQNGLFREKALGSFYDLFLAVTANPAMLVFLDGIDNEKGDSNENYAREMMELFSLGADRGLDDRVIVQLWSEFGRHPQENGSGTDHGAAGVAFLIGTQVVGTVIGEFPGLSKLDENENLLNTSDFRAMYCSLLEQWFQTEAGLVIPEAASFERPTLLKA
jgi:hypothetical protein